VGQSFHDQPLIEARLRVTLGRSFFLLGEVKIATEQYQTARTIYTKYLGADHPDTLASMAGLAFNYNALGRHAEALALHEEALGLRRSKLGPDHPDTLRSMLGVATTYAHLGRHADAIKLYEETLALQKARLGSDHPNTLATMTNLANEYSHLGRHADAVKLSEETLTLKLAKLGPDHHDTPISMNNLAWTLATTPDVKLRDPRRAVELAAKAAQAEPTTDGHRGTLGTARYRAGDWKGAIADLEQAIGLRKPDDPRNANEGFFLAMAHWQLGEKGQAREWFAKSVQWMEKGNQDDAELKRFRAEAAGLLGVEKKD
jgi:tetratricopeptide (TPR) repeat protein